MAVPRALRGCGAQAWAQAAARRSPLAASSLLRARWSAASAVAQIPVEAAEPAWLGVRQASVSSWKEAPAEKAIAAPKSSEDANLRVAPLFRLETATASSVINEALRLALTPAEGHERWEGVVARLKKLELNPTEAVLALHCMVKMDCHDTELLERVVDRIECRYFSMELGLDHHDALDLFVHEGSFQSLVNSLPLSHKVKIILVRCTGRPNSGALKLRRRREEPDPQKAWKTADPVEMEEWERERFAKGRIKVARMRNVTARPNRMAPGKRLRATLAAQLMQVLPRADVGVLAEVSQVCAFPEVRLLHGDLQDDFVEALARRVDGLDTHVILPYTLAVASAMRSLEGPAALRTWRRKLVPSILRLLRSPKVLELLDGQLFVHPRLGGVAQVQGLPQASPSAQDAVRAERSARLLIAVAGARQVALDAQIFDALCTPLEAIIGSRLEGATAEDPSQSLLLPLETIADLLGACASSGVRGGKLPQQLAGLLSMQYGPSNPSGHQTLSNGAMVDLCTVAHGLALLCENSEQQLELLWEVAEPKLRTSQPHLALMLINALVRSASDELLTAPTVLAAVDEVLVQKLDYDSAALGRIAS